MSGKAIGVLVALGAIWGASFMFIKVAGAELQPFMLVEVRLAVAALVLLGVVASQRDVMRAMRANWRPLAMMGLINCALPYTLITWGETYISSGLAAIFNACAPLWAAGLGLVWAWGERLSPGRLFGVLVGMCGVILAVSSNLTSGQDTSMQLLGQGAVLLAALLYAVSGIYGRKKLQGLPVLAPAAGQLVTGALMLLPLALFQLPTRVPSLAAIGAITTLAVAGTALASLMFYWLLRNIGAARTLLVTYLLPCFALVWGALFLSEHITPMSIAGLLLVLVGISITTGGSAFVWNRLRRKSSEAVV